MKKMIGIVALVFVLAVLFVGCAPANNTDADPTQAPTAAPGETAAPVVETEPPAQSNFDTGRMINVISREEGSGTRGAFIELMGIEVKGDDGSTVDRTTAEATISNGTQVVMSSVTGDLYAIGYISLGSLNDTVKAVKVDGFEPTVDNIKSGDYGIARPFNIAAKGELTGLAADFIAFIMSAEGQAVVADHYIAVDDAAPAYAGDKPAGRIVVGGSTSVSPLMEKLVEAYKAINTQAEIEIQMSGSSAGMTGAIDGTYDIGMASRDLKDSEAAELNATVIALDGIAIIVNLDNPVSELTKAQIHDIYVGDTTQWNEILA